MLSFLRQAVDQIFGTVKDVYIPINIPGRIILFTGWLSHYVDPNLQEYPSPDGDSISISFNFYQQKLKPMS
ncbi:MAG: hypothetical protein QNJ64_03240 [Crocosphaera sp.]|nr:hypothetical protein [Crocosphaera sp.]